jgi:extracellular elastinolytic metalloproteinase
VRTGLFNSAAARIDTAAVPLFVRPLVALPVNLLSFTARQAGQDVLLNWQSSNEVNFKEYRIEHSTDGNTWTNIGTTDAKSQDVNDYLFYHYHASPGANHYRIKMVDVDGRFRYSVVRVVTISKNERLLVELIPNPASQFTSMHFSESMSNPVIVIVDAMGKVVSKIQLNGSISSYDLSTARLPSGSYMVKITSDKLSVSQKLIVRR